MYLKNISFDIVAKIVKSLISFILSLLIARSLGPSLQGNYSFYLLIVSSISTFGFFGVDSSSAILFKEGKYTSDQIFSSNIWFVCFITLVSFIGMLILTTYGVLNFDYLVFIYVTMMTLFTFIHNLFYEYFISTYNLIKFNYISIYIAFFELIIFLVFLIFDFNSIYVFLFIKVLVLFLTIIIFLFISKINIYFYFKLDIIKYEVRLGFFLYLGIILNFLNYRIDHFLISSLIDNYSLGLYSISTKITEYSQFFFISLGSIFLSRLYQINDIKLRIDLLKLNLKINFFIFPFIIIGTFILSYLVPLFYGTDYYPSANLIRILIFSTFGLSIVRISSSFLFIQKNTKVIFIFSFISLLINFVGNLFFLRKFGIQGAAYMSLISYNFLGLSFLVYLIFKYKIRLYIWDILPNKYDINRLLKTLRLKK